MVLVIIMYESNTRNIYITSVAVIMCEQLANDSKKAPLESNYMLCKTCENLKNVNRSCWQTEIESFSLA